jgi:hypothetical protein
MSSCGLAHHFRCLPALVFAGIFVFTAALRAQDAGPSVACEAYCSTAKPGTSVIEVQWPISQAPLSPGELKSRVGQQAVEVTVFEDGFDRGLFASLPAVAPKGRFRVNRPAGAAVQTIPGLTRLTVSDVATSRDQNRPQPMRLLGVAAPGGPESMIMLVEGLEPGLNYFWQVPDPAGGRTVITCQAATCPVDLKRAPERAPARPGKK